ncbi:MAG: 50S ribosomal protein L34e [Thermosphaera sp.]
MPRPMLRSRSWRRTSIRTPSGRVVVHYEKRRPGVAKCSVCGKPLNGVPSLRPPGMAKLAKTEKRPERMFGGTVCPECLARGLREAVRLQA